MFSFASAPRRGHLDRVKRMIGYLAGMKRAAVRCGTEQPDYFDVHEPSYD